MQIKIASGILSAVITLVAASSAHPDSLIADAAEDNDLKRIMLLLRQSEDETAAQPDGTTALHWAVYHDNTEMAAFLLAAGCEVNATNDYGVPPLALACTNANAKLVKGLLRAGANPNAALPGGETPLMIASRTGSLEAINALLERGVDPNTTERQKQTAIMWAAAEGHAAIVQSLINSGADYNARLDSGFTPLFFAIREGKTAVVKTLLDAGLNVNDPLYHENTAVISKLAKSGTSPLMLAMENGHFELAVTLLESGANPNDQRTGLAPLHAMTRVRKPDVSDLGDPAPQGSGDVSSLQFIRELVSAGADINGLLEVGESKPPKINLQGATPFLLAADRADTPMMRLLLELGADPKIPNVENTTPLMVAAGLGTTAPIEEAGTEPEAYEATQLMLELGGDINAIDNNGETAMHGAAYGSFPTIVQLLADSGADPKIWNKINKHGSTPLYISEGYRPGNFKPGPQTIKAIHKVMLTQNLTLEGNRPEFVGHYEKLRLKALEEDKK